MKNKTDYELVTIWNDNSNTHWRTRQQIESIFYKKYTPLFKSQCSQIKGVTFEDAMQDCYLLMLPALEYAGKKLGENDSFGGILKTRIKPTLRAHFYREETKFNFNCTSTDNNFLKNESESYEFNVDIKDEYILDEEIIFEEAKQKFIDSLTKEEETLYYLLEQKVDRHEVMKKLKVKCSSNVSYKIAKLRKKYKFSMNEFGYSI